MSFEVYKLVLEHVWYVHQVLLAKNNFVRKTISVNIRIKIKKI